MKEKLKTFKFAAKKVVPKKLRLEAKKIKDKYEKMETLEHAIKSQIDLKLYKIETILNDLKKKEVDVFHIFTKTNLLKTKIKYYNVTHHKADFLKVIKLFDEIEKDLDTL